MRLTPMILSLVVAAGLGLPAPSDAQTSRFGPAIVVNNHAVSAYELEQRLAFLKILNAPGDIQALAEKGLIEDRLKLDLAKQMGISLTDAQIAAGMAEFAGRANLETEQFLQAIGQGGVAPETFRDFVRAGLVWREVVRQKYGKQISISEAEIDRALSVTQKRGAGPRVLISELLIPVSPATALETEDLMKGLAETVRSEAQFAEAARAHSVAASRAQGGRVDWIPLTNLPPQLRGMLAQMQPGQITPPLNLQGTAAMFMLRGIQEGGDIAPQNVTVDYAQLLIPGGRSPVALAEAERVRGEVDTCDDLYRVAAKTPDRLQRQSQRLNAVPGDIARELDGLDERESSTALVRGDSLVFLMLCDRDATKALPSVTPAVALTGDTEAPKVDETLGFGNGPSRDQIRAELMDQRLGAVAEGYIAELRANAVIKYP